MPKLIKYPHVRKCVAYKHTYRLTCKSTNFGERIIREIFQKGLNDKKKSDYTEGDPKSIIAENHNFRHPISTENYSIGTAHVIVSALIIKQDFFV